MAFFSKKPSDTSVPPSDLSGAVMRALGTVQDPDLHRDLVSLNMIRDLTVSPAGDVKFRVMLTTPACPLKAKIEADCRAAVESVTGVKSVAITMDAEVRKSAGASAPGGTQSIPGVVHVIAVSSGKGGVGKSTVSVNLACALAAEGARVGLMDADIYGPNIPTMMGVVSEPKVHVDPVKGEMLVPAESHGVKVISMGFLVPGDQAMIWRGPMLHSMVNQFAHKVLWGELDYLVIDLPPGTGDVQLSLAQLVPITGAVMVTTPQEVALQDVRKAFSMWEKVNVPVLGVVENMSYFRGDDGKQYAIFGSGGGELLSKKYKVPLLSQVPIVPLIRQGGDEGYPITLRNPEHEVSQSYRTLARRVAQEVSIRTATKIPGPELIQIGKF